MGELYKMGCAVTIRNSLVHNGSELCLDKTTYFDKTDYEVEVEYEEKNQCGFTYETNFSRSEI